ncbi:dihydrofolate reductase family protein [Algoriphagus aestuariicola]|uniref:Dihydrofolate reductase family protein n=1 Tax=Algoriphagus aestuariicola TaxID=1852016 RepID=A0ABS3BK85_9BACT|nr:dihydrofolate reductase family protein [Algoriphagus aestuariicola]MBN7799704.1 dihydrofolate reductase family protein [Algoriphagus aestuariicola]
MRKLKLQMQLSLDGFNSTGPNDEQQWVTWAWDEIKSHVLDLARSCDTELIGRSLAEDYLPFWKNVLSQPDSPMYEAAEIKADQKKVVFTQTKDESIWESTTLAKGDLAEEVRQLKQQEGKDMIVYGGSSFVANLVKAGLVDEFHLYINPIAIGHGTALFDNLVDWQRLKLITSITFPSGIILLQYEKI